MKKLVIFLTLIIYTGIVFSQNKSDSNTNEEIQLNSADKSSSLTQETKDLLNSETAEKSFDHMPWVVALIIGILSASINIWVADRMKKSNEKTINLQLTNAKELALSEFKASLGTKNRQDWIDELRHNLSELISQSAMINIELATGENNSDKIKPYFEKMNYNKAKIAMLLNNDKLEQKQVVDDVYKLLVKSFDLQNDYDAAGFKKAEDELMKSSRNLFNIHWKKIKNSFTESH